MSIMIKHVHYYSVMGKKWFLLFFYLTEKQPPVKYNNLSLFLASSGHVSNWIELTGSLLPIPDLMTQFLSSHLRKYKSYFEWPGISVREMNRCPSTVAAKRPNRQWNITQHEWESSRETRNMNLIKWKWNSFLPFFFCIRNTKSNVKLSAQHGKRNFVLDHVGAPVCCDVNTKTESGA